MKLRSALQILLIAVSVLTTSAATAADEGKPAPELTVKLLSGKSFGLKQSAGKVVVIHFWATWCASCVKEMPALESYFVKHRAEGLEVIAISMDKHEDEQKVREAMKAYSFSGAMGGDANYKEYGRIWRLPMTFVIDKQGILRKDGWDGEKTGFDSAALEGAVTPLLKAQK